jgi:hypothetical protein
MSLLDHKKVIEELEKRGYFKNAYIIYDADISNLCAPLDDKDRSTLFKIRWLLGNWETFKLDDLLLLNDKKLQVLSENPYNAKELITLGFKDSELLALNDVIFQLFFEKTRDLRLLVHQLGFQLSDLLNCEIERLEILLNQGRLISIETAIDEWKFTTNDLLTIDSASLDHEYRKFERLEMLLSPYYRPAITTLIKEFGFTPANFMEINICKLKFILPSDQNAIRNNIHCIREATSEGTTALDIIKLEMSELTKLLNSKNYIKKPSHPQAKFRYRIAGPILLGIVIGLAAHIGATVFLGLGLWALPALAGLATTTFTFGQQFYDKFKYSALKTYIEKSERITHDVTNNEIQAFETGCQDQKGYLPWFRNMTNINSTLHYRAYCAGREAVKTQNEIVCTRMKRMGAPFTQV